MSGAKNPSLDYMEQLLRITAGARIPQSVKKLREPSFVYHEPEIQAAFLPVSPFD